MTMTTETVTEEAAALERLRAYREQIQRADRQADQNSLDRAADLELLYQAKQWVDQLPAPKNTVWRGRPVDPQSRNRFASWVLQQTGLHPSRVRQLHDAREVIGLIDTPYQEFLSGEYSVRPLKRLRKLGYSESISEVLKRAVQLAEGQSVTSAETTQAVRDFLATHTSGQRRAAVAAETIRQRQERIRAQFVVLLGADKESAGLTLNALIDLYNEQVNQ